MADNGKNTIDRSTTDGSTLEVRDSNYYQHTQALKGMAEIQLELSRILETIQADVTSEGVPRFGHDVLLERALAAIAKINISARFAMKRLPAELTQQHLTQQRLVIHKNRATEAFHIPEIAENILSRLFPEDLLRAQQVDRNISNIIQGSLVLQQALFLKPRLTGPFKVFPCNNPEPLSRSHPKIPEVPYLPLYRYFNHLADPYETSMITDNTSTPKLGKTIFDFQISERLEKATVGAKVSSMLICQPPVYVMQVTMDCCEDGDNEIEDIRRQERSFHDQGEARHHNRTHVGGYKNHARAASAVSIPWLRKKVTARPWAGKLRARGRASNLVADIPDHGHA